MKRISIIVVVFISAIIATVQLLTPADSRTFNDPIQAPEFTHTDQNEWINSEPQMLDKLKGKVVLIDFWTFGCWNCYRSFPWLKAMETRLAPQGLQIIGVHTPEFENEKIKDNIVAKVKEFGLYHPVMIDNDFSYWRAMNNRYWPAYYIIDKSGRLRTSYVGETHEGDRRAKQIENLIISLLKES